MSNLFIVGMGVGTVFIGLLCIVLLCLIMSAICRAFERKPKTAEAPAAPVSAEKPIENRQEIIRLSLPLLRRKWEQIFPQ